MADFLNDTHCEKINQLILWHKQQAAYYTTMEGLPTEISKFHDASASAIEGLLTLWFADGDPEETSFVEQYSKWKGTESYERSRRNENGR